ncbi:MAG: hypothetical protein ACI82E_000167 [Nonlabens sp.]|jgi:hypothetical protein
MPGSNENKLEVSKDYAESKLNKKAIQKLKAVS